MMKSPSIQPGIVKVSVESLNGAGGREFEVLTRYPQLAVTEFLKGMQDAKQVVPGDLRITTSTKHAGGFDGPSYDDLVRIVFGGLKG